MTKRVANTIKFMTGKIWKVQKLKAKMALSLKSKLKIVSCPIVLLKR